MGIVLLSNTEIMSVLNNETYVGALVLLVVQDFLVGLEVQFESLRRYPDLLSDPRLLCHPYLLVGLQ